MFVESHHVRSKWVWFAEVAAMESVQSLAPRAYVGPEICVYVPRSDICAEQAKLLAGAAPRRLSILSARHSSNHDHTHTSQARAARRGQGSGACPIRSLKHDTALQPVPKP